MLTLALQVAAVFAGVASAYYWWRSSQKPVEVVDELSDKFSDNSFSFLVDGKHMVIDLPKQSRLSGLGAKWAAGSILAQAAAVGISALTAI